MSKIEYLKSPTVLCNDDFWFLWCCDCGLRHIYFFKIIRGKLPKDDKVEIYITRDDWATDARKREKRRIKKLKGKK